jgi:surface antigen
MIFRHVLVLAFTAASIAGCTTTSDGTASRQQTGTAVGAVAGGILGAALGPRGGGRVATGIIGAVAGGMIGNAIGKSLDDKARREAEMAEYRALEGGAPGAPVAWRSDRYYGTVTPGPDYERPGYARCREYAHTIYIDGQPETARGVACRQSDGSWAPV